MTVYLWWQSTVKPAPFDVMFEVRQSDTLRVSRVEDGWAISAPDGVKPVTLRVETADDALGDVCAVTAANGCYHVSAHRHPPSRCFFEVELQDGRAIHTAERVLPLEGPANFRDLGGYETADGRRLAWSTVYRADGLDRLTGRDSETLYDLGIKLLCDLRTDAEVEARPDPMLEGIVYCHMPIFAKDPLGRAAAIFNRHRLDVMFKEFYRTAIVDAGAPVLGEVLRLIADPANLPLVIHCAGGKDRTGVAAALLLHVCGVPRDVIVADYSLTNLSIDKTLSNIRQVFGGTKPPGGLRIEQLYPVLSARPELIEQALTHIDASYGSIDQYLRGPAGLSDRDAEAIRVNLLQ